ncbi:MAG: SRPBCC family protein [Acidobacteria bacterium]|nr:MAG: SRPBCC family protein [Acidobacteriota bacterium]
MSIKTPDAAFRPACVEHAGGFRLDLPPEQAIALFTAPGERLWVPGWNPTLLSGDGTAAGTVFVTPEGPHTTIWVVVDYDPQAFRARYSRTTPGIKAGTVGVEVRADGEGGSEVRVTYALTALSEDGNRELAAFDAARYSQMMKEWQQLIRDATAERRPGAPLP